MPRTLLDGWGCGHDCRDDNCSGCKVVDPLAAGLIKKDTAMSFIDMAHQSHIIPPEMIQRGPWTIHHPARDAKGYDYEMKSWPWFYSEMTAGKKKHDMRDKRKRSYKVGDRVLLREWDPRSGSYTGEQCVFEITYITSNDSPCALSSGGLDRNMAILSMQPVMESVQ